MKYGIVFTKSALKELLDIPKSDIQRILQKIDLLADEPRPKGSKKLKGFKVDLWRIRIGNYRVIYSVEDVIRVVEIISVGNRKDIY